VDTRADDGSDRKAGTLQRGGVGEERRGKTGRLARLPAGWFGLVCWARWSSVARVEWVAGTGRRDGHAVLGRVKDMGVSVMLTG